MNFKKIIIEIIKDIIFSVITFIVIKFIINSLAEDSDNLSGLLILSLFFLSSLAYIIISKIKINIKYLIGVIPLLFLLMFLTEILVIDLIAVSIFFPIIFILITKAISRPNNPLKYFIGGLLFILASEFILLILFIKIDYSIDEGFLFLFLFLYLIYSSFLYLSLLLTAFIWKFRYQDGPPSCVSSFKNLTYPSTLLLLFILIFSLGYWHSLDLFNKPLDLSRFNNNDIFYEIEGWSNNNFEFAHNNLTKANLIEYLKNIDDEKIDRIGCLYLLTNDIKWGEKFKETLLKGAVSNQFLNAGGSVKAWQMEVSNRVYFYLKIKEHSPDLFNENENRTIINWFKNINEYSYKITLADYSYAYLFKQRPTGFYYNQEIGFGMLALLLNALRDDYPELAKSNKNILDKYAVGWSKNFRNTDDGIVYHQDVWIKNSYLLYHYANIGDLKNAKLSFDWILHQSPFQSGAHPNYNSFSKNSSLGSMIIGYSLLKDARYKYLAENFLLEDIKNKAYSDSYIGFDLWNDDIPSIQPVVKSYYIKGTTGMDVEPKELKADKLILRKIINNKELFMLINLRSAGWHRYNGSGSVIMVKYDDKIIFKNNLNEKIHRWLPKGKARHRDKKIINKEIGFYQPPSRGIELLFYHLFSFDDTLKYKNYRKFINKFEISKDNINIKLDNNNNLIIDLKNNDLLIYYNNYDNKIISYNLD